MWSRTLGTGCSFSRAVEVSWPSNQTWFPSSSPQPSQHPIFTLIVSWQDQALQRRHFLVAIRQVPAYYQPVVEKINILIGLLRGNTVRSLCPQSKIYPRTKPDHRRAEPEPADWPGEYKAGYTKGDPSPRCETSGRLSREGLREGGTIAGKERWWKREPRGGGGQTECWRSWRQFIGWSLWRKWQEVKLCRNMKTRLKVWILS